MFEFLRVSLSAALCRGRNDRLTRSSQRKHWNMNPSQCQISGILPYHFFFCFDYGRYNLSSLLMVEIRLLGTMQTETKNSIPEIKPISSPN
ncbi:unnamed protein product [Wuchereria bancrofti]|uniref:Uncharacterized protein n=1 Tax=Wuchereria bancrofti TaxID=6293 RepID=A0A3P7FNL4_WUCBA|nr:unnamed protein product [Wuchereria bancrofti]